MPYWIQDTLLATPALAWMFLGVGLPWALVALPRHDWRDKPMMALMALAFGPALVTAWMFVLGSWQTPLLRLEWVLAGTALIAAVGWALVWRKRRLIPGGRGELPVPYGEKHTQPALDEKLLVALIAVALVIRWLGVAYWPFSAYDALWVYGYEGRLYTLLGYIPNTIGYYPQFLPLQYTYLQLATGGVINDHTARAVIPFLHLGSILAAYTLGNRLFNRRVGVYAAALWALYPHVAEWSRFGDLEIPTTFLFTAAAAFFLLAWKKSSVFSLQFSVQNSALSTQYFGLGTRNYAVIAGLLLGIGMWTKPTMGAFIWGVALLAAVELGLWWLEQRRGRPVRSPRRTARIHVVLWTGLACLPLGAVWYVRNALLGHPLITLPTDFWLTLAARSGAEFGWPLLAVLLTVGYVGTRYIVSLRGGNAEQHDGSLLLILLGLALVLAGVLPSMIEPRRMAVLEWLALAA
ncbi:MAG: glycosyltransferase family 39 protein [Chloroflexi bacterium]|nr:glycosyltransferase family 39 protein [Chloroflexota bacterium]